MSRGTRRRVASLGMAEPECEPVPFRAQLGQQRPRDVGGLRADLAEASRAGEHRDHRAGQDEHQLVAAQVARRAGLMGQTICRIEERYYSPALDRWQILASALETTLLELLPLP
jgi:hypothetical protein